ncbi:MAG: glycosyltransferase [Streptosporangiales bacterium]|nr:glycosyltransferase [Streptosporangiales bacterium]
MDPRRAVRLHRHPRGTLSPDLAYGRHVVTAVLVAHDGKRWLPETLDLLLRQTRPVQRIVAVDNGSRDGSESLLVEAIGRQNVVSLPRDTGYGAAVAEALRNRAANTAQTGPLDISRSETEEWVWLLHDDSAPAPDALERLLKAAEEDQFAAVLGPKLLDWHDRRRLVEIGVAIDGAGRRETGLEVREVDQGQHDDVREALAVSTAGMLVRRDVWTTLGGLDPDLPLFRDDVDFGWRVNGAGHKVLAVADAVMWHAEASARRRRRIAATGNHPRRVDRRNAMFVLFANLPARPLLWVAIRNFFGSLLRTAVFLLAKQPANALDEVAALASVFGSPGRLRRARKRRARGRRRNYHSIRRLMPPRGQQLRRLGETVGGLLSGAGPVDSAGRHHAVVSGSFLEEDDDALLVEDGAWRRFLTQPGVLLCFALVAVTAVAARGLIGGGQLGGGALPPVAGGASDLWAQYAASWHAVGIGGDVSASPYVLVLAMLSTVLLGKVWLAVDLLLFGCVPLAAATAYLAVRRVTSYVPMQLSVAAAYALLPTALGAIATGRLGTAVVTALLPLIGMTLVDVLRRPRRRAARAAWVAGLLLAIATAFAPLTWALALVLGFAAGRWRPSRRMYIAVALVTPMVLLLPWSLRLLRHPSLFLIEAGLHRPELVERSLDPLAILSLQPGGPGMPLVWPSVAILAAGVAALAIAVRRTLVLAAWAVALLGLVVAVVITGVEVAAPGEQSAPPWPGIPLAVAAAGILVAAAAGGERLRELVGAAGWRRAAGRGLVLAAAVVPALAAAGWVVGAVPGPLNRDSHDVLPAFVAASSNNGARARTLVVHREADGHIAYSVLRGRSAVPGESELPPPESVRNRFDAIVAGLTSGRGGDEADKLASFAVRYVLLPAPLDNDLVQTLNGVPGLERISVTEGAALWRVTTPTARLRLASGQESAPLPSGQVSAWPEIPEGSEGRMLVLAEPFDSGWRASIDGQQLPARVVGGWAQGFEVPASGGRLELGHTSLRSLWLVCQGLLVFIVLVLALPGVRDEERDEGIERRERRRGRGHTGRRARGHRARETGQQERVPEKVGGGP